MVAVCSSDSAAASSSASACCSGGMTLGGRETHQGSGPPPQLTREPGGATELVPDSVIQSTTKGSQKDQTIRRRLTSSSQSSSPCLNCFWCKPAGGPYLPSTEREGSSWERARGKATPAAVKPTYLACFSNISSILCFLKWNRFMMALRTVSVLCFSGQEERQASAGGQLGTTRRFRLLLGARRSLREKSYTRHMGRNCSLRTEHSE